MAHESEPEPSALPAGFPEHLRGLRERLIGRPAERPAPAGPSPDAIAYRDATAELVRALDDNSRMLSASLAATERHSEALAENSRAIRESWERHDALADEGEDWRKGGE